MARRTNHLGGEGAARLVLRKYAEM
jgi:hypothetical protein